jgi:hypothetical protein
VGLEEVNVMLAEGGTDLDGGGGVEDVSSRVVCEVSKTIGFQRGLARGEKSSCRLQRG